MKERFINDLTASAENIIYACNRLRELNVMREKFHGGETATLTLTLGESVIETRWLKSDGTTTIAEDLFKVAERKARVTIDEAICDCQTILEAESGE